MRNKRYRNNSITRECNVVSNFFNLIKCARTKNSHNAPILKGCMNTSSGKVKFKNFQVPFNSGNSSTIVNGKLMSNHKSKETAKLMW